MTPYIELEYITFTGTQSIDFGKDIWNSDNWKLEWKMKLASLYDYQSLFAIDKGDDASPNETWVYSNGKLAIRFNNKKAETHTLSANTVYNCELYRAASTVTCTILEKSTASYNLGVVNVQGNLRFGNTPTSQRRFTGDIYNFKFSNIATQEILMDLIPVKRKSDDVVCFYDKISGAYILNDGTGEFVAGPEVIE